MRLRSLAATLLCAQILAACGAPARTAAEAGADAAGAGAESLDSAAAARQVEAERLVTAGSVSSDD